MTNYQLLALDLDGTLLNNKKKITNESIKCIKKVYAEGMKVIISTGRGYPRVETLIDDLGLDIPMVLLNGAEVRLNKEKVIDRTFLKSSSIRTLHSFAKESNSKFWGYNVSSQVTWKQWSSEMFKLQWLKFGMKNQNISVINSMKDRIKRVDENVEVTSSANNNIECSLKGVTKESGVLTVCNFFNIDMSNVVAIGDNLNDYGLLKLAGLGIAMGNADERLKAISDKVTDTNENEGIAYAIKNFL